MKSFLEIEEARSRAGLTRKALYERAGLHKETWRRTARGATAPNIKTLERLTIALDELTTEKERADG